MSRATESLAAMLAEGGPGTTRRPSFEKRCGIFYALYMSDKRDSKNPNRTSAATIARAFGITPSAASRLARALTPRSKFKSIAKEFERLGEKAFGETYFTDEMWDALNEARKEKNPSGPGPQSDSHKGFHQIFTFEDGTPQIVFVAWTEQPTRGWTYIPCYGYENGEFNFEHFDHIRERTSRAALIAAYGGRGAPAELPPAITKAEVIARLSKNIT
jgi:hypothetical protein